MKEIIRRPPYHGEERLVFVHDYYPSLLLKNTEVKQGTTSVVNARYSSSHYLYCPYFSQAL